ncbi:MAG: ankyrin repeat domain-containing protein [Pyrinomonadaceae bacterium]
MKRQVCLLLTLALCALAATHAFAQDKQKLNDDLWDAVRRGDTPAVKTLLDAGADANAKWRYQQTPLFKASERGDVEIVRMLLEHGADVNLRDTFYQATPITWASDKGHVEVVRLLLDKGAGANGGLENVLQTGVGNGNVEMVKLVLAKGGVDADTLSNALASANEEKNTEIAELLKQAGAKPPREANFQVDAATLKSYEGTYKPEQGAELKVAVNAEGKLTIVASGGTTVLGAFDKTSFRPAAFAGVVITFTVEGDKVTGFTLKQGQSLQVYKKQ